MSPAAAMALLLFSLAWLFCFACGMFTSRTLAFFAALILAGFAAAAIEGLSRPEPDFTTPNEFIPQNFK
jgi:hypothetical protein